MRLNANLYRTCCIFQFYHTLNSLPSPLTNSAAKFLNYAWNTAVIVHCIFVSEKNLIIHKKIQQRKVEGYAFGEHNGILVFVEIKYVLASYITNKMCCKDFVKNSS